MAVPGTTSAIARAGRATPLAAAGISGALLWVASPAVGVPAALWVALVPAATVALAGGGRRGRLAIPLAYGVYLELLLVPALPFGLAEGQYGEPPLPIMVGDSPVLAVALVAIPAVVGALYLLRFGTAWGLERLHDPWGPIAAVAVPALAWTALDFARVSVDPGGAFGPLYLSQAGSEAAAIGTIGGPWLLTALAVAVNYGGALALLRRRPLPALVPAALAVATLLAGLASEPGPGSSARAIGVAAVQPGFDTAREDRPELRRFEPETYPGAALDMIAALDRPTREAAAAGAEVIAWPEAALFVDPRRHPRVLRALGAVAERAGVRLVVGWFAYDEQSSSVGVVGPEGELDGVRPKQRPMWFLEEDARDSRAEPIESAGLRIGTLLGVDASEPGLSAALAARGADIVVSATHDWPGLATQQRAATRFAARAAGVPIARAEWRYGSAIYTAEGEPIADAGEPRRTELLIAEVSSGAPTPYAHLGDAGGWIAVALTAIAAAAAIGRRRDRG